MELHQHCGTAARRQKVRDSGAVVGGVRLNGMNYLEVLDRDAPSEALRQRLLDVTFLLPDGLAALKRENFRISGGSRITGLGVTAVEDGPGDRTLRLTVSGAGDFSAYELSLHADAGADAPPAHMDRALSRLSFRFKAECQSEFDCKAGSPAAPPPPAEPAIDYLAKDYASFRRMMLDRMAAAIPGWTERSPADLGVTLVEALATAADRASYYQDAVATEAFLPLARLRASVLRHARLLGYAAGEGSNARTVVHLRAAADRTQSSPPLLPAGTRFLTRPTGLAEPLPEAVPPDPGLVDRAVAAGALVFESMEDVTSLRVARNEIRLHSWGESACCLPAGATVAHAAGTRAALGLARGDLLLLEEMIPAGGAAADPPDPAHRQVVRLDRDPVEMTDHLGPTAVLELHWAAEDALRFPLNLAGDAGLPGAVARGNLVPADHGRSVEFGAPLPEDAEIASGRSGLVRDAAPGAAFRPRLVAAPVVHAPPHDAATAREEPAAALLAPAAATVAQVTLRGGGETWAARPDLLASDRFAPDFKLEPLEDGGARILFGDGTHGRRPDPGTRFTARIRIGGGTAGNVGADALLHLVTGDPGLFEAVRNPVPASGGTAAESEVAIKIAAPRGFRRQRRAVTEADYAAAAEAFPGVQRAAAERRWTGSWHTVFLHLDRLGGRPVDAHFEAALRRHLAAQRLAGHDLQIVPPSYAALDIELIVCACTGHDTAAVARSLAGEFSAGHTPAGQPGFFHPDNFTFGQPVRLSAIIARAMTVPGVLWAGVALEGEPLPGRFERMDQPGIDHAASGLIPVGAKEIARLDSDQNAPENGRIRFRMRGGQ
ncbi:putative baseplate assembly protein [Falsiroseomonas sp.]|uniref:putative baseplate assembly protein n=1 Tax=Falsiroseomonas sp. TaxID=2870721 RepID=UPI002724B1FB|nr:putative baseplate assembly protein [Falsiroseomonas sp.]MDO9498781.1 putative baseplate assembly protein [Falsiroseomonas sp.]